MLRRAAWIAGIVLVNGSLAAIAAVRRESIGWAWEAVLFTTVMNVSFALTLRMSPAATSQGKEYPIAVEEAERSIRLTRYRWWAMTMAALVAVWISDGLRLIGSKESVESWTSFVRSGYIAGLAGFYIILWEGSFRIGTALAYLRSMRDPERTPDFAARRSARIHEIAAAYRTMCLRVAGIIACLSALTCVAQESLEEGLAPWLYAVLLAACLTVALAYPWLRYASDLSDKSVAGDEAAHTPVMG